ncbi:GFA family protein [Cereibacter changlensis]|uniref:GFA family protein n=1 Tax=Cereibacter changlensis TaxID=402884 RepID=A0A4V6WLS1_9RHOB|nr:GFA family protein [Cereibacter changlensis]TKA97947.1 GFA family protein [Cereibacter changlensis]
MRDGWSHQPAAKGGCQCGAVRYSLPAGPKKATLCHCRMCQRASGNAFVPLLELLSSEVVWHGTPATWASSSLAERGFCATCGTPLFYRSGDTTEIMAGSLAPGFTFTPTANHGVEARMPWVNHIAALPDRETRPGLVAGVTSHQSEET